MSEFETDYVGAMLGHKHSSCDKREVLERLIVTAIGNRKAAAGPAVRLLRSQDRQKFKPSVAFWGERIGRLRDALNATENDAVWAEHASTLSRLRALIEAELRRTSVPQIKQRVMK
jgi:hypothetical protein